MLNNYRSSGWFGLAVALSMAAFFISRYLPPGFLEGTSSYWLTETEDVTQYIAGFNAFFQAPFQLPLLAFDGLNYPVGTRATFVDAVPFYALVLKVLLPNTHAPFNPFGYWIGFVFLMQGFCAWWILREARIHSWLALVAMVTLFLTFPALSERIGHTSLMSHWIVLCAFALYMRDGSKEFVQFGLWGTLLFIGFYVNVYLFVMALTIYFASGLRHKVYLSPKAGLKFIIPLVALVLSLFVMIFPLQTGEVAKELGFGFFSMNLLSPFAGGRVFTIPNAAMPGQYEGFNYLGLGILIGLGLLYFLCSDKKQQLRRHIYLAVAFLLFFFYALSNHVYFGTVEILQIEYPTFMDSLTSQFRASGRFFWVVGYGAIIVVVIGLYRYCKPSLFVGFLTLVLVVQMYDLSSVRHRFVANVNRPYQPVLSVSEWDSRLLPSVKYLYFYPKFRCHNLDVLRTLMPVMKYSVHNRIKLNTGYIARYQPSCDDDAIKVEIAGAKSTESAFVFDRQLYTALPMVQALFANDRQPVCEILDFAYVCKVE